MQVGLDDLESPGDECDDCMKRATVTEWLLCVVRQKRGSDGEVSRAVLLRENDLVGLTGRGRGCFGYWIVLLRVKLFQCRSEGPRCSRLWDFLGNEACGSCFD